jgi:ubiquinone/menaquinone biosynthesis C-methylase UbiE
MLDVVGWDHNHHYHGYLLRQIPPHCGNLLEIGCGTGSFSRLVSPHAGSIVAIDLSPVMIETATRRSSAYSNIEFQAADVQTLEFPRERYDCIVSIATLHHLSFMHIVQKMKSALKANGAILVLDLYQPEGVRDALRNILAVPVHAFLKVKHTGRLQEPIEVREAWAEHGKHDTYLRISEVRRTCQELLPGAVIKVHLLWRYSVVWVKPA